MIKKSRNSKKMGGKNKEQRKILIWELWTIELLSNISGSKAVWRKVIRLKVNL